MYVYGCAYVVRVWLELVLFRGNAICHNDGTFTNRSIIHVHVRLLFFTISIHFNLCVTRFSFCKCETNKNIYGWRCWFLFVLRPNIVKSQLQKKRKILGKIQRELPSLIKAIYLQTKFNYIKLMCRILKFNLN